MSGRKAIVNRAECFDFMENDAKAGPLNPQTWLFPNEGGKLLITCKLMNGDRNPHWFLAGDRIPRNLARLLISGYTIDDN